MPTTPAQGTPPTTFAEVETILASKISNYTPRPPQQLGASCVESAIASGNHLILQAGTGVGKSFLGTIPAILSGKRTVIATATKALQSQLVEKDLPTLQEHLNFTWSMLQGRGNYFCSNRATLLLEEEPLVKSLLEESAAPGFSGLREEFSQDIPNGLWTKVCSDSEECGDLGCSKREGDFALVARRIALDSNVVVVNHALLCRDLINHHEFGFSMLGEFEVAIVDEMHELENYAKSALGVNFSEGSILSLTSQVRAFARRSLTSEQEALINKAESEILGAQQLLWMAFSMMMRDERSKALRLLPQHFGDYAAEWEGLCLALVRYSKLLSSIQADAKGATRWKMLSNRAVRLSSKFNNLILDAVEESVRWLEIERRNGMDHVIIKTQPIRVDDFLSATLFSQVTVVCMSATAKVGGRFDFLAKRLGVGEFDGVDVGTVFNYPLQSRLYVPPKGFPEPSGRTRQDWETLAPQKILELVEASEGRALLLFTSFTSLQRAYDYISPKVSFTCLRQGEAPVPVLTQKFKNDTHSILFATRTFMTGVDVQGESLSLVVLDKLVFTHPEDPIYSAECEIIDAQGGSSFGSLALPQMQLVVEQAAGRLIRTVTDRGVFAVLDTRLRSKSYGSQVVKSLPPMPMVESVDQVKEFFEAV